ncbi:MAG: antibiotic biosynthesis monooxygenase family protein [Acidimicrobiia bacterium]
MDAALAEFEAHTLPSLRGQPGYRGVYVLTTPDGKGALLSLWETEDEALADGRSSFYEQELSHFATLFRAPPGRETYEVVLVDEPSTRV